MGVGCVCDSSKINLFLNCVAIVVQEGNIVAAKADTVWALAPRLKFNAISLTSIINFAASLKN